LVGLSQCGSLFWCNQVAIADFSLSLEMTGLVGNNKGQKGENGSAIFPFLFSLSRWRRHVERSETSVGDREEVFSLFLASSSAAAGKESAGLSQNNPFL